MRDLLESLDQISVQEDSIIDELPFAGRSLTDIADKIRIGFEDQLATKLNIDKLERSEHEFMIVYTGDVEGTDVELTVRVNWSTDGTPRKPVVIGYGYVDGEDIELFHYRTDLPDGVLVRLLDSDAAYDIISRAQDAMEESAKDLSAITRLSRS